MTAILCSSINQSLVGSFENYKLYAKSILDLTEEVEINLVKKERNLKNEQLGDCFALNNSFSSQGNVFTPIIFIIFLDIDL